MIEILSQEESKKKRKGGRPNKLSLQNQLLMALEYIREYRTYFHIAQRGYAVSESSAYKSIRWVEDTLVKHPDFALPGRKELLKNEIEYEIVLVDATQTPIQRPKKDKSITIQARRKGIC